MGNESNVLRKESGPSPAALQVFGNLVTVMVASRETGGRCAVCEVRVEPRGSVPVQTHRYEDELFYVLDGRFVFEAEGREITAPEGAPVFVPRHVPFRFRNTGDGAGRLLVVAMPGGLDLFFDEISQLGRGLDVLDKHGIQVAE